MTKRRRTIRFPHDLHRQARIAAAMDGVTVPALVASAVRCWLEGDPEPPGDLSAPQAQSTRQAIPFPPGLDRRLERTARRLEATAQDCVLAAVRERIESNGGMR